MWQFFGCGSHLTTIWLPPFPINFCSMNFFLSYRSGYISFNGFVLSSSLSSFWPSIPICISKQYNLGSIINLDIPHSFIWSIDQNLAMLCIQNDSNACLDHSECFPLNQFIFIQSEDLEIESSLGNYLNCIWMGWNIQALSQFICWHQEEDLRSHMHCLISSQSCRVFLKVLIDQSEQMSIFFILRRFCCRFHTQVLCLTLRNVELIHYLWVLPWRWWWSRQQ